MTEAKEANETPCKPKALAAPLPALDWDMVLAGAESEDAELLVVDIELSGLGVKTPMGLLLRQVVKASLIAVDVSGGGDLTVAFPAKLQLSLLKAVSSKYCDMAHSSLCAALHDE